MFFGQDQLQLGRGESMADTAQVLSRYLHMVILRLHKHEDLEAYAANSSIPVINALTDRFHPCQLLADLQTIIEYCGRLEGVKVTFLGDGNNNMANSWALAAAMTGIDLRIGAPVDHQPDASWISTLPSYGSVQLIEDPVAAVKDADIVYTDVWVSMGFEAEAEERLAVLAPYQVNAALLRHASGDVKVMHCLPAYREKEIAAEVLDGPASIVWDQAENRLHAQKAVMAQLIRG